MKTIKVTIRDKIAVAEKDALYICGNSDFVIAFDFDDEWAGYEYKTARFVFNDTFADVVFSGNECAVPVLSNTYNFIVGVYAGDLCTTTPAYVAAKKSILCDSGSPAEPFGDIYVQMFQQITEAPVFSKSLTMGERRKGSTVGNMSVSLGLYNEASGGGACAIGWNNVATGTSSFAEGKETTSSGYASHAEGVDTESSGYASHAEGTGTIASASNQHVQGRYNEVIDNYAAYLHVVGNGSSETQRSNAHTLDYRGNAWFAGTVEGTALILLSPGGKRFKITVDDNGTLSTKELTE